MLDTIRRWFASGVSSVVGLAARTRDALTSLWSALETFFFRQLQAWGSLQGTTLAFLNAMFHFGNAIVAATPWLVTVYLPQRLLVLQTVIVLWALQRFAEVRAWAASLVDSARSFAGFLVSNLRALVAGWVRTLTGWIDVLRHDLGDTARRVRDLLTDPSTLADWLVGAMFHAFLVFAERQSERFGRWLLGQGIRAALRTLPLVERVIARVL